jgi:hypothetical protein
MKHIITLSGGVKPQKETTTDDARKILKDYYKEKENDNR